MKMNRAWHMPNRNTFSIKPIKDIIIKYIQEQNPDIILDPFANNNNIKNLIESVSNKSSYITNDLDASHSCDYNLEASDFLNLFDDNSIDFVLYDPPYSNRQISEVYKKINRVVSIQDTQSSYFSKFKKQIKRIVKKDGIVISFGWNSNGIGKCNDFEIIEILIVAHGAAHNDTIVTIERKIK